MKRLVCWRSRGAGDGVAGRRFLRSVMLLAVVWAVAVPGLAVDPMLEAGLAPNTIQQGDATGYVNMLNGALTLRFPIGPTFEVNEALSYQPVLAYSSSLRNWFPHEIPGNEQMYYIRGRSTVGWGWVMHFGRIAPEPYLYELQGYRYQDPEGVWHELFD